MNLNLLSGPSGPNSSCLQRSVLYPVKAFYAQLLDQTAGKNGLSKALSDTALCLVLALLNYEIQNSHFPASVKPFTVSTFRKRASPCNLINYRGVCCSNFLRGTLSRGSTNDSVPTFFVSLSYFPGK